jgi:hypothetical protein
MTQRFNPELNIDRIVKYQKDQPDLNHNENDENEDQEQKVPVEYLMVNDKRIFRPLIPLKMTEKLVVIDDSMQYRRTDDNKTEEIIKLINSSKNFQGALNLLTSGPSNGSKNQKALSNANTTVQDILRENKIILYGKDQKCGYKGLAKYMPHTMMEIWRLNNPKEAFMFFNGIESMFDYNNLVDLQVDPASRLKIYIELLKKINFHLVIKKRSSEQEKELRRLYTYFLTYPDPKNKATQAMKDIISKLQDVEFKIVNNPDIKDVDLNGEINF